LHLLATFTKTVSIAAKCLAVVAVVRPIVRATDSHLVMANFFDQACERSTVHDDRRRFNATGALFDNFSLFHVPPPVSMIDYRTEIGIVYKIRISRRNGKSRVYDHVISGTI
jgi:hypothetical protein